MLSLVVGRVIVDPTTYVFSDGNQALNYEKPRKKR
ncbi:MAG: hypothetical protein IMZ40_01900 [Bacilli bacterium]|nr:hypothetical protein [Bacilli bacterium]